MRRSKLDKIDKKILKTLQADGRISNVDLAEKVGISAPPCLRRMKTLQTSGYIKSYHAKVNALMLGYGVTIFALVKLTTHAEQELTKFEKKVVEFPEVRECYMLAGDIDFMLKIVAKDWDDYQIFLTDRLTALSNVQSVKSTLAVRAAKDEPGIPIDEEA